jgi:hypothetical protein
MDYCRCLLLHVQLVACLLLQQVNKTFEFCETTILSKYEFMEMRTKDYGRRNYFDALASVKATIAMNSD